MKTIFKSATILLCSTLALTGCSNQDASSDVSTVAADNKAVVQTQQSAGVTELQVTDVVKGEGATAAVGQDVVVHYTGWLYQPGEPDNKGKKFDSSLDRGQPFVFPLGGGRVIQGWDQGVAGMQVGGKRLLVIPPEMGYGASGAGGVIPPNATLIFEVDLLEIQ